MDAKPPKVSYYPFIEIARHKQNIYRVLKESIFLKEHKSHKNWVTRLVMPSEQCSVAVHHYLDLSSISSGMQNVPIFHIQVPYKLGLESLKVYIPR